MRNHLACAILILVNVLNASAAPTDDVYKLGPDSNVQPNVPQGKVAGPLTLPSKVYPNTTRNYWVYTPAQYDPAKPACLMIFQDGHFFVNPTGEYRIPIVFDNLIYRREMPVTSTPAAPPSRRKPPTRTGATAPTTAASNTTRWMTNTPSSSSTSSSPS